MDMTPQRRMVYMWIEIVDTAILVILIIWAYIDIFDCRPKRKKDEDERRNPSNV